MKDSIFVKFAKAVTNVSREQRGMTGLETAIILIAFVTVAAVFGYAVLSAGLFSAERDKETIYGALQQAKANMELSGSVIVQSGDKVTADNITFTVRNAIAGTPIDMTANAGGDENKCVISLTTADAYYNNIEWAVAPLGASDGDYLLEMGEQFAITTDLTDLPSGTFADPQRLSPV